MKTLTAMASAALLAAACAHPAPIKAPTPQLPTLSIPVPVIKAVCDQAKPEQGSGHWDGRSELLWAADGHVVAIECGLTVFADGLSTSAVRIYLDDPRARALRDVLQSRGH